MIFSKVQINRAPIADFVLKQYEFRILEKFREKLKKYNLIVRSQRFAQQTYDINQLANDVAFVSIC